MTSRLVTDKEVFWVRLVCNRCGQAFNGMPGIYRFRSARAFAARSGWAWRRGPDGMMRDLCPACGRTGAPQEG